MSQSQSSEKGAEGWVTHHAQNHNIQTAPSCTLRVLAAVKTVKLRGDHLQQPAHDSTGQF